MMLRQMLVATFIHIFFLISFSVEVKAADGSKDYYKILEIPKSASNADIKKAYRNLALKWHPDKNQDRKEEATQRFQEISEAYEVLSDESTRRRYDQGDMGGGFGGRGGRGPGGFHGFQGRSPEDIFKEFFGDRDPFAGFDDFFKGAGFPGSGMPGGGFSTSSFSSLQSGGGPSFTSTTTTTVIRNGKRVTKTVTSRNGVEEISYDEGGSGGGRRRSMLDFEF